jgi:hypothetical protein
MATQAPAMILSFVTPLTWAEAGVKVKKRNKMAPMPSILRIISYLLIPRLRRRKLTAQQFFYFADFLLLLHGRAEIGKQDFRVGLLG